MGEGDAREGLILAGCFANETKPYILIFPIQNISGYYNTAFHEYGHFKGMNEEEADAFASSWSCEEK